MKAIKIDRYGGPEVLDYAEVEDPAAGPGDVLIAVHAASVNPIDWKMREGYTAKTRPLAFPAVLGRDFSGVVKAPP